MNDDQLRTILKGAPVADNPMSAQELLRQGRRSSGGVPLRAMAALILLGGVLAIGLSSEGEPLQDDGLRTRGVGDSAELGFSWAIEGVSGLYDKAEVVGLDQQVIFLARTSVAGYLCIDEEVTDQSWKRVFPTGVGAWKVNSGEHHIERDGQVQSFVTDHGPGLRRYRLAFHPEASDCSGSRNTRLVELLWRAP
jgi:hypothetical protein